MTALQYLYLSHLLSDGHFIQFMEARFDVTDAGGDWLEFECDLLALEDEVLEVQGAFEVIYQSIKG